MNDWLTSTLIQENNNIQNGEIEENKKLSISDLVAQTASQVVRQQHNEHFASLGFHWCDEWALFYNASSGYFYDPNSNLFFHPTTQLYYKYNDETGEYDKIESGNDGQTQMSTAKWSKKTFRRRINRILGDDYVQSFEWFNDLVSKCYSNQINKAGQDDVDVAELTLDLVDRCSFLVGDYCDKQMKKRTLLMEMAAQDEEEFSGGVPIKRPSLRPADDFSDSGSTDESDTDSANSAERLHDEFVRRQQEEEIARHAPCIRLVEQPRGRLHIVTICGARVGFGHSMDVQIGDDTNVAGAGVTSSSSLREAGEELFFIRYSSDTSEYQMEWLSRTVCAEKDGHYLEPGVSHLVQHENMVSVWPRPVDAHITPHTQPQIISLSFHIHNGLNTCQGCEPGLFLQSMPIDGNESVEMPPKKRLSRYAEHRRQMRALKEQYGLLGEDINSEMANNNELRKKYLDRAGRRRRQIGSELPFPSTTVLNSAGGIYTHCTAAPQPGCSSDSVLLQQQMKSEGSASSSTVPINADNKGFKLLKRMGWTEGQGLGKHSQGIQGPISAQLKNDRVGFGTSLTTTKSSEINIQLLSKQQRNVLQMQKRFAQLVEAPNDDRDKTIHAER